MRAARPWALAVLFLAGRSGYGQTLVDNVPAERGSGTAASAKREAGMSRISLGPVKLLPVFGLGGIGYSNNIGGTDARPRGDVTANANGGVRAVLPVGTRTYLRGYSGLTYGWFLRETKRRHLGFSYDAGVATSAGRFIIDVGIASSQAVGQFSSEVERPVFHRNFSGHARVEMDLLERLSVFVNGGLMQPRYDAEGLDPAQQAGIRQLERTETLYGVGLRYKLSSRFDVAGQVQATRLRFRNDSSRDANGTGYVGSIGYDGNRLYTDVNLGYREYRSNPGGVATRSAGTFGGVRFDYELFRRTRVGLYGQRQRNESIFIGSTFYVTTSVGVSFHHMLGRRNLLTIGGFCDVGANRYDRPVTVGDTTQVRRVDDIFRFGGSIAAPVTRFFHLSIAGSRTKYTSNVPGSDRQIWQILTNIAYVPTLTEGSR